jgi:hypothetical protein
MFAGLSWRETLFASAHRKMPFCLWLIAVIGISPFEPKILREALKLRCGETYLQGTSISWENSQ